jgi:hypothetical protein
MIREFSKRSLSAMLDELRQLDHSLNDPLERMSSSLKVVQTNIKRLQQICQEQGFLSQEEEIYFFKHIKPEFACQHIFVVERFIMERNMPQRDAEAQRLYFLAEMAYVERFFLSQPLAYEYFSLGLTEFDGRYFLRNGDGGGLMFPEVVDQDKNFASPADYLFSRFRAYRMLKDWIMERLDYLARNPHITYAPGVQVGELKWTGDSVNLAELGYAVALSGQINYGQAGIAQVFRWLEEKLSVNIGVPARRLASIRSRKRLSRTKFLDELKEVLEHKMDEDDGR